MASIFSFTSNHIQSSAKIVPLTQVARMGYIDPKR